MGGQTVNPATEILANSEVQWQHLQFTRNFYGLLLNSFNDLDNQIHGCLFTDNQFGISNPHGNFYMMQTRFERNNITDVFNGGSGCNSGSIWRSVSVNSSSFVIDGGWCGVGQPLKVHDCRVEGWGGKGGAAVAASIGMATALYNRSAGNRAGLARSSDSCGH